MYLFPDFNRSSLLFPSLSKSSLSISIEEFVIKLSEYLGTDNLSLSEYPYVLNIKSPSVSVLILTSTLNSKLCLGLSSVSFHVILTNCCPVPLKLLSKTSIFPLLFPQIPLASVDSKVFSTIVIPLGNNTDC